MVWIIEIQFKRAFRKKEIFNAVDDNLTFEPSKRKTETQLSEMKYGEFITFIQGTNIVSYNCDEISKITATPIPYKG